MGYSGENFSSFSMMSRI